jgi:hypothetical protein
MFLIQAEKSNNKDKIEIKVISYLQSIDISSLNHIAHVSKPFSAQGHK